MLLGTDLLLIALSCVFVRLLALNIPCMDVVLLVLAFSTIALVTYIIFLIGQSKEPQSQTFHTLAAISLKLLLELVLVLIWFIAAKKNTLQDVIMFFVLYLALTLFSVIYILKILKAKML